MQALNRSITALAFATLTGCGIVENASNGIAFEVDNTRLFMSGTITSQTPRAFRTTLAENPQITTIVMTQVFGSADDEAMIDMGYFARAKGLNTHIPATGEVNSGGVDFFLAGRRRSIEAGALVGVHSWADGFGEGRDYPRDAPEHQLNRQYIADMLGSDAFYWFTLDAAPSDDIHHMTFGEMRRFGMTN
jgi:hypothetical protein